MEKRDPVRELWRVTIDKVSDICGHVSVKHPTHWHVALEGYSNARTVMALCRKRFTPEWWENYTISAIEPIGRLHVLDGKALYEDAD